MPVYSAAVADYFRRPAMGCGTAVSGEAGSPEQGGWIRVYADVRNGILCNVGFRAFACPHIIASCNWLMELLDGKAGEALCEVSLEELRIKFDIPVEKAGKLLILQDALRACSADFENYTAQRKTS